MLDYRVESVSRAFLSHELSQPELVAAVVRAAALLGQAGRWTAAALLLEHALEFAPQSPQLRILLGEALSECGYFAEGAAVLQVIIREAPREALAHYHLAGCLAGLQREEEALEAAQAALAAEPDNLLFQRRVQLLSGPA